MQRRPVVFNTLSYTSFYISTRGKCFKKKKDRKGWGRMIFNDNAFTNTEGLPVFFFWESKIQLLPLEMLAV